MNLFTISQLAQFSGVKPHTIRMWEQRYKSLSPSRSKGNTRYYDDTQLRRLLNIVSLIDSGYRVSELCTLSDQELFTRIGEFQKLRESKGIEAYYISQLIKAGMGYDEWLFEKMFSHCLLRLGMKDTYTKVVYPMMARMGILWSHDAFSPAYEHFNSNLLRQKFFTAIDSLPPARSGGQAWLLFLPEGEFHELGLLFAHYLIKFSGRRSIYLGGDLPLGSVASAVDEAVIGNLLLFMVHNDTPQRAQEYLDRLCGEFPDKKIYLSGNPELIRQLQIHFPIDWLREVEDLEQVLLQGV